MKEHIIAFHIDSSGRKCVNRISLDSHWGVLVDKHIVPCVLNSYFEPCGNYFFDDPLTTKYRCVVNIVIDCDTAPMDWSQVEVLLNEPGFVVNFYETMHGHVVPVEIKQ